MCESDDKNEEVLTRMKKLLNKVRHLDTDTLEIFKKSISSIFVKILGMAFAFGISVFLGRTIGASGLGTVNLANQIASVLLVVTLFGMQHVIVKRTAISYGNSEEQGVKDTLNTSLKFNGIIGVFISLLFILLAYFFTDDLFDDAQLRIPIIIILAALLPQTLSRVYAAAINGLGKIWQSNLFEQVLSYVMVGMVLLISYLAQMEITVVYVACLYAISRTMIYLFALFYWKRLSPSQLHGRFILRPMLKSALPLLLVSSTLVLATNIDTIMLGTLNNTKAVGLYSVASRIALLTSFMLQVSNTAISPKLAFMYSKNDMVGIQKMVKQTTLGVIGVATFFLLIFIFWGKWILSLWGSEFEASYLPLIILCAGQFFNVSTGCSGLLLIMTGHEKTHRNISLISLLLNISLNYVLISLYGINGAALATAITVSLENFLKVIYAKKKTGVLSFPI